MNIRSVIRATRPIGTANAFAADVIAGLTASPKNLPPKYFYDLTGSALFERITELPEYYPTRCEIGILQADAPAIASMFPPGCALIEFGSGSSRKARIILGAAATVEAYVPVDISGDFLQQDLAQLKRDLPHLVVHPLVKDFTQPFAIPPQLADLPRVGFFPGSTIGNFEPDEALHFLRHIGRILGRDSLLIVGIDLVKDEQTLVRAYNDADGITAKFNLNLLARINRELGADFDLAAFRHRAFFNREASRIEMHLASTGRQTVRIDGMTVGFAAGETVHTENSYKYSVGAFQSLARRSGWTPFKTFTDGMFCVHALRMVEEPTTDEDAGV
ncbi:MAG TPA: L-histidine N(alpha)-methyltransferase [Xanthobacteraceae bacterium]|nr:L-histidine N(alpha)-methyltransferase [Xanthobacteraceae bacterium]